LQLIFFLSFSQLSAVEQQVLFNSLHLLSQAAVGVLQLANKRSSSSLGALEMLQILFQELASIMKSPPSQLPSDTLNSCAMAAVLSFDRICKGIQAKVFNLIVNLNGFTYFSIAGEITRHLSYNSW